MKKKERMRESCMLIMSLQGGKESLPRQRKNNKEKRGFSNWKQKWKEAQRCLQLLHTGGGS